MNKQIYTVFACDCWTDNMELLMVTTSVRKLKSFIAQKIEDETFTYDKGVELPISQQVKLFKNDFENAPRNTINDRLHYGFLDYCYDGKEI